MARVTVVNDNPEFLELMGEVLESERYETTTIDGDQPGVLELVRASKPDVLILDLRMGSDDLHGWNVTLELRRDSELQDLPVLLTSADLHGLREVEARLQVERAVELLPKPFGIDELTTAIERLLGQPRIV